MPLNVLFWNINGRDNGFFPTLQTVAKDVNILMLAESKIDDSLIESNLQLSRIKYKSDFDENELTPRLYSNIENKFLEHFSTSPSKRMVFYTLSSKEYIDITLVCIHFPSKATYNGNTQLSFANNYAKWIRDVEKLKGHNRTIIIGDFNMNPFESGMIEPQAFNATLSYDIAKSGKRTSHFAKFEYFYNPMWNWLGDREFNTGNFKTPGSFYYKTTADVNQIFWNVFDKVIVRPSIIDVIDYPSITINEAIPRDVLIAQDCEKKEDTYTDHLPLMFNLKTTL